MGAEPGARLELGQRPLELSGIAAEDDVPAPAAEPGLEHERQRERRPVSGADGLRLRVREACSLECPGGEQLVVRREQDARRIEDFDSPLLEERERREPVLDPVERLPHVQPGKRHVARPEARYGGGGVEERDLQPVDRHRREMGIRLAGTVRHDSELHLQCIVRRLGACDGVPSGVRLVRGWCRWM